MQRFWVQHQCTASRSLGPQAADAVRPVNFPASQGRQSAAAAARSAGGAADSYYGTPSCHACPNPALCQRCGRQQLPPALGPRAQEVRPTQKLHTCTREDNCSGRFQLANSFVDESCAIWHLVPTDILPSLLACI